MKKLLLYFFTLFIFLTLLSEAKYLNTLLGETGNLAIEIKLVGSEEVINLLDISRVDLKSLVENKLKQKGINIVKKSPDVLVVNLTLLKAKECYTFALDIDLIQTVLSAKTYNTSRASVYSSGNIGYLCGMSLVKPTIDEKLNVLLDQMIIDYSNARSATKK